MGVLARKWVRRGSGPKPPDFGDNFFLRELQMQCEFALAAYGEMRTLHQSQPKHPSLLAFAHVMLVFAGNAAKLLVASPRASAESKDRTVRLRASLATEDIDLTEAVNARNYLEHFDERMERFLAVPGGILLHRFIEDHEPRDITLDDGRVVKPRFLQSLNTSEWYLNLHGDRIHLEKIANTVEAILTKVRANFNAQGVPGYGNAAQRVA